MRSSKIFLLPIFAALVSACSMSSSTKGSGGDTPQPTPVVYENIVLIDQMTPVPNINGSGTETVIYVHNYAKTPATNLSFSLTNTLPASSTAKRSTSLKNKALNTIADGDGFQVINPETCTSIPAGGYCTVKIKTSTLDVADSKHKVIKLNYSLLAKSQTTNQIVNYYYVDAKTNNGINFTGNTTISAPQGTTRHAVGFMYAGGAPGTKYDSVSIQQVTKYSGIKVVNGFSTNQSMVANTMSAVEFEVVTQSSQPISLQGYAKWNSGETGNLALLTVDPIPDKPNYSFGKASIMAAPSTAANSISVENSGTIDGYAPLTVTTEGGTNSDKLIMVNGCEGVTLTKNSGNTCKVDLSVTDYQSGDTDVVFKENGTEVGRQHVYWVNKQAVPSLIMLPTPSVTTVEKNSEQAQNAISFSVSNIGKAPADNVAFSKYLAQNYADWVQDSNNCPSSINPKGTCILTGHLKASANDGVGTMRYKATGEFNGKSYNWASGALNYTVTAKPQLDISAATESPMVIKANGRDIVTRDFTVKNIGNDPALLTKEELLDHGTTTTVKPVIAADGCSGKSLNTNESCIITVRYGPASADHTVAETGTAEVSVDYHGGTPDTQNNHKKSFTYQIIANDSKIVVTGPVVVGFTGAGDSGTPYDGNASINTMSLTYTYTNPVTATYPASNFKLVLTPSDMNPYIPSGDCLSKTELAVGASCSLTLTLSRDYLANSDPAPSADPSVNFNIPAVSWTTPFGVYSQSNDYVNVNYHQPFATLSAVQVGTDVKLSIVPSNLEYRDTGSALTLVTEDAYFINPPVVSQGTGCQIIPNGDLYSLSCDLTKGNSEITESFAGIDFELSITLFLNMSAGFAGTNVDTIDLHYVP